MDNDRSKARHGNSGNIDDKAMLRADLSGIDLGVAAGRSLDDKNLRNPQLTEQFGPQPTDNRHLSLNTVISSARDGSVIAHHVRHAMSAIGTHFAGSGAGDNHWGASPSGALLQGSSSSNTQAPFLITMPSFSADPVHALSVAAYPFSQGIVDFAQTQLSGHAGGLGRFQDTDFHSGHSANYISGGATGSDPSGQLWFGIDDLLNSGLDHIDSDGAGLDVADHPVEGGGTNVHAVSEVLDGANGLYFAYGRDDLLRSGHITNDTETNSASEIATTNMVYGTGIDADEVNAIAIDPLNHIVFIGLWGQSDQYTGILEVRYNPTTGALTNPYNATTGVVTDLSHMLVDDDNSGKVNGTTALTNIVAMQYDMQNGDLYYVDQTNIFAGGGSSGFDWAQRNGIFVVSTTGNVQAGTQPTPTQLSLNSQFAAGDNNNYIEGLAINEAQGLIYFAVNNASNSTSKLYYMPIAGGVSATPMAIPGGVTFVFADDDGTGTNPLAFDPNQRQLYVSDNESHEIVQFNLSTDGKSFTGGNSAFVTTDPANGGTPTGLYFDPLPTLSSLTTTTTEALQGGSALTLLTASPTITDPQDGATNKLHMGFLQVVIANAQSGDSLFYNGLQSGTFDSGKMSISWSSSAHTLTLTGDETEAFYDSLFTGITFQDGGTDNSSGSHPTRAVNWIVSDGITTVNHTASDPNFHQTTVVIDRAPTLVADAPAGDVLESGTASANAAAGVKANDSDKDGDTLTITGFKNSSNVSGAVGSSLTGAYGTLTLNLDGSYSYTADQTGPIDAAATGSHPVDTFTYTVSDGLGDVSTTTVSFTINRAPTAVADNYSVVESGTSTGTAGTAGTGVLGNDSDKDGDTLTIVDVNGATGDVGASTAGTYGSLTLFADGHYSYSASNTSAINSAATGSHPVDTFTYTDSDGHGGTTTQTVSFSIDRAPTPVADSYAVVVSDTVSGTAGEAGTGVLGNDSDPDGDSLTVVDVNGVSGNVGASTAGSYGFLTLHADGSYSYTADTSFSAPTGSHPVDTFTYTVSDGHGATTTQNLSFTIDRNPIVGADNYSLQESGTSTGTAGEAGTGVFANDSDPDGDTISVSAVNFSAGSVGASTAGSYGDLTLNADGSYSYSASLTANIDSAPTGSHPVDSFIYTVSDGHGGTNTTSVNFTINRAPVGNADDITVFAGATGSASTYGTGALSVDSDPDGDSLTVTALSGGTLGTALAGTYGELTLNANGTYSYTADNTTNIDAQADNAVLTDSFTYTLSDGHGGTTTANLVVTVDQAPTVTSLGAAATSGADLTVAHTVTFTIDVGKDVTVAGGTTLALSNGETATYSAGSGTQTLTFTDSSATQTPGAPTVSSISSGSIADAAGNALSLAGTAVSSYTDAVSDLAANVSAQFDNLDAIVSHITTITLTDGSTPFLDLTVDQTLNDTTLINKIVSAYYLDVHDSAADIQGSYDALAADVSNIAVVSFTDAGTPTLTITETQWNDDSALQAKLKGPYDLHVTGFSSATTPEIGISGTPPTYDSATFVYNASDALTQSIYYNNDGSTTYVDHTGGQTIDDSASTTADFFDLSNGNATTVTGNTGATAVSDSFYLGAAFAANDAITGTGGNDNQIGLDGDYSGGLTLGATTITDIQVIACLPGFNYNLTTNDGNVAAGQTLTIWAANLASTNTLTFNGSAETDGNFIVYGGSGNDTLTGGHGNDTFYGDGGADTMTGGAGNDVFAYAQVSDSTSSTYDTITDFDAAADKFQFPHTVTGINTAITVGTLSSGGTFDTQLAADVNAAGLGAHHAVLFTPNLGSLAGQTFLIVDANGTAGYQAGHDYVIDITGATNLASLTTSDFVT